MNHASHAQAELQCLKLIQTKTKLIIVVKGIAFWKSYIYVVFAFFPRIMQVD